MGCLLRAATAAASASCCVASQDLLHSTAHLHIAFQDDGFLGVFADAVPDKRVPAGATAGQDSGASTLLASSAICCALCVRHTTAAAVARCFTHPQGHQNTHTTAAVAVLVWRHMPGVTGLLLLLLQTCSHCLHPPAALLQHSTLLLCGWLPHYNCQSLCAHWAG